MDVLVDCQSLVCCYFHAMVSLNISAGTHLSSYYFDLSGPLTTLIKFRNEKT